ncbi:protein Ycf2-like [Leptopilina heterotoma]|uniref:protein Ycf2-like n=1 Tax=Leptopilina heterotoma TaxID=63436 RepID=UPI001CA8B694|nr:protein Ycf2-like [Leptopilina heterotoma]
MQSSISNDSVCRICDKRFSRNSSVAIHLKTVHKCKKCKKCCGYFKELPHDDEPCIEKKCPHCRFTGKNGFQTLINIMQFHDVNEVCNTAEEEVIEIENEEERSDIIINQEDKIEVQEEIEMEEEEEEIIVIDEDQEKIEMEEEKEEEEQEEEEDIKQNKCIGECSKAHRSYLKHIERQYISN